VAESTCRERFRGTQLRTSMDNPEGRFRLRLAEGFLSEASQDVGSERWRSCVDNCQLATENAAKAAAAVLGPVGRTHYPSSLLRLGLAEDRFPEPLRASVARLAELAEILGADLHAKSDYGDEATGRTPWEMFDEQDATACFDWATEAVSLAVQILA